MIDADDLFEERANVASVHVRVIAVREDGALELACGHFVRRKKRGGAAICEHCFPLHYAKSVEKLKLNVACSRSKEKD